MSEEIEKRQAKCRRDYHIIVKQFRELMAKLDAMDPPKKKQKRPAKNSEAANPTLPALSEKAAYKDLEETIRGFLKELSDDDDDEEKTRGTSMTMSSVEGNK